MFLDETEWTEEKMTGHQDHAHQVKNECGPETSVNVGDDTQG